MELITLIIFGLFMLSANYLGYKQGKGESIDLIPKRFKPILRTEEQEAELVNKLRSKKNG